MKVWLAVFGAVTAAMVVANWPEIVRYRRMLAM